MSRLVVSSQTAKSTINPTRFASRRRMSAHNWWKVRGSSLLAVLGNRRWMRARSSRAARLVKVTQRMRSGGTPLSRARATRSVSTVVLPVPAGASARTGPCRCSTMVHCSSLSRSSVAVQRAGRSVTAVSLGTRTSPSETDHSIHAPTGHVYRDGRARRQFCPARYPDEARSSGTRPTPSIWARIAAAAGDPSDQSTSLTCPRADFFAPYMA